MPGGSVILKIIVVMLEMALRIPRLLLQLLPAMQSPMLQGTQLLLEMVPYVKTLLNALSRLSLRSDIAEPPAIASKWTNEKTPYRAKKRRRLLYSPTDGPLIRVRNEKMTPLASTCVSESRVIHIPGSKTMDARRWWTGDPKRVTCPPFPLRHQNRRRHRRHNRRRHRRHNLSTFIIILARVLSASTSSSSSSSSSATAQQTLKKMLFRVSLPQGCKNCHG